MMLVNATPRQPMVGPKYSMNGDVIFASQRRHASAVCNASSQLAHTVCSQLRLVAIFAFSLNAAQLFTGLPTPFGAHIANVVRLCPKKEMIKAHTRSVVAMVAEEQTVWNKSVFLFPQPSIRELTLLTPYAELRPVTAGLACSPFPATIPRLFIDESPESRHGIGTRPAKRVSHIDSVSRVVSI